MSLVNRLMTSTELAQPLPPAEAETLAGELSRIADLGVYPRSISARGCVLFFLGRGETAKYLGVVHAGAALAGEFTGEARDITLDGRTREAQTAFRVFCAFLWDLGVSRVLCYACLDRKLRISSYWCWRWPGITENR